MSIFPDSWTQRTRVIVVLMVVGVIATFGYFASYASKMSDIEPTATWGMPNRAASTSTPVPLPPGVYEVRYILKTSSAQSVRVVYNNATEGMETRESMPLSGYKATEWMYQMERGTHAYITVSTPRNTPPPVSISCELLVNGERVEYTEAKGPLASVTCSTIVGR